MASEQWAKGETCRDLIEDRKWLKALAQPKPEKRDDDEPEPVERDYTVEVSGKRFEVTVHGEPMLAAANGAAPAQARKPARARARARAAAAAAATRSPRRCRATCSRCWSRRAPRSRRARSICIIEAMKMENEITAHKAGKIAELPISEGAAVKSGDLLAVIK